MLETLFCELFKSTNRYTYLPALVKSKPTQRYELIPLLTYYVSCLLKYIHLPKGHVTGIE